MHIVELSKSAGEGSEFDKIQRRLTLVQCTVQICNLLAAGTNLAIVFIPKEQIVILNGTLAVSAAVHVTGGVLQYGEAWYASEVAEN
jgi:hypothetical protein